MTNVFVTGGSGFLGKTLIRELVKKGVKIKALVRPQSKQKIKKHPSIEKIVGDIREKSSFESALRDIDTVFHLAGVVTDWAPKKLYEEVHIKGTQNILEATIQYNVKKFIHISTIDVLDHEHYSCIDETTPYTQSRAPYRYTKVAAERLLLSDKIKKHIETIIIRPSWIYGPGDTTFFPEILYQIYNGTMVFIGNPNNTMPLIHVENLAEAIINARELKNNTFVLSDGETTWKDLTQRMANALAKNPPKICIPYSIAYSLAGIMELWGHITKSKNRPLLTRTAVEMIGKSIKVRTQKGKKFLHFSPRISLDEGIEASIQWLLRKPIEQLRKK